MNPRALMLRILAGSGLLLALAGVSGCDLADSLLKKEPPANAIAIVGDDWITRADVLAELNTLGLDSVSEADVARYVNRWIDDKLLMHEAREMNLHREESFQRALKELEQELLNAELLRRMTEVDTPSATQVVAYWKDHTGEYRRVSAEVSLVIGRVDSKNRAWRLREGFDQSLGAAQMFDEIGVSRLDTLRTVSVKRLPAEVAEAIEPLRSGHASLPVYYQDDWLIIKVLERFDARSTRPVEEVEPLVVARMMAEERTRRQHDYLEALRRDARQTGLVRIRLPQPHAGDVDADVPTPDNTRPASQTQE